MHRILRVLVLALLLAVTVASSSAFASPPPARGTIGALSAVWEPLARLWDWLSGQAAPSAGRGSVLKAAPQPANSPTPAAPPARTDDGLGADPNG